MVSKGHPLSKEEIAERVREGGRKGGRAAQALRTPERRSEIGRMGGEVRGKQIREAIERMRKEGQEQRKKEAA